MSKKVVSFSSKSKKLKSRSQDEIMADRKKKRQERQENLVRSWGK